MTDPAGGVTEYTYDASHWILTLKDARGIVFLTNRYDDNGRVDLQSRRTRRPISWRLHPNAVTTTYGYGAFSLLTSVTDP